MPTLAPNVVLFDPNKTLCRDIAFDLENIGFDVITTTNANITHQALCSQNAVALIMNIDALGHRGITLLDNLLNSQKIPPVVILITSNATFNAGEAFLRGVDAVFTSPFSEKALVNLVKDAAQPQLKNHLRRSTRINTHFNIIVKVLSTANNLEGVVMNISQGGAFVEIHKGESPAVNGKITFEISFPDNTIVEGRGTVSWIRLLENGSMRTGFGVQFDHGSPNIEKLFLAVNQLKTTALI